MNAKKVKQIRQTVRQLATAAITDLAYQQNRKTGTIKVAPGTKRDMIQKMKSTLKHVGKAKR